VADPADCLTLVAKSAQLDFADGGKCFESLILLGLTEPPAGFFPIYGGVFAMLAAEINKPASSSLLMKHFDMLCS
jgi:hypothetical protein